MKRDALIEELLKLDPDTEIVTNDCQGFGCMGSIVSGIEIIETRHTEWDHKLKKPLHTTAYQIRGVD